MAKAEIAITNGNFSCARDRASYLVAGRARHEVGAQIIEKLAMRTRIHMAQGAGCMLKQRQIIIPTNEVLECVAKVG